jgi:hypothetical protein
VRHSDTSSLNAHEVVAYLLARLGRTAIAYIARSRSRAMPALWAAHSADAAGAEPSVGAARRLKATCDIFKSIEVGENAQIARSWLLSANPRLGGATPIELIRNDDYPAVRRAAEAFVRDAYYA